MLLPAVGLACELLTVGGELGPDSGLLPGSKKIFTDKTRLNECENEREKQKQNLPK